MRPLLVLEDIAHPSRRLFTALGVEWWATRWAWAGPLFWLALGWGVAWGERMGQGDAVAWGGAQTLWAGAAYGALLWLTNLTHTLGHVVASLAVGTPMDAVVVTSTRDVTVYRGAKRTAPPGVRALRSLGGPLANVLVGVVTVGLEAGPPTPGGAADGTPWLLVFGVLNLCVAAWTLAPVPTLDGWIVWGWILRRVRRGP
jgi:Zn-dependent protease